MSFGELVCSVRYYLHIPHLLENWHIRAVMTY